MTLKPLVDTQELYAEIGRRIKKVRNERDITQRDLANQAGLKQASSITHIENGKQNASIASLINISIILDVPLLSLLPDQLSLKELSEKNDDLVVVGGKTTSLSPKGKDILDELLSK